MRIASHTRQFRRLVSPLRKDGIEDAARAKQYTRPIAVEGKDVRARVASALPSADPEKTPIHGRCQLLSPRLGALSIAASTRKNSRIVSFAGITDASHPRHTDNAG